MTSVARRTIQELIVRYNLEPGLEDVYVEGSLDQDILNSALSGMKTNKAIYRIDTVNVPSEILSSYGLSSGNKQRVISLAKELSINVNKVCNYVLLVDSDFDHWLGVVNSAPGLRRTIYASLDLHFLSEDAVKELVVEVCRARIPNFKLYFEAITKILLDLYVVKLAAMRLGWDVKWLCLDKSLSESGGVIRLDSAGYINKSLNSSGKVSSEEVLKKEIEEVEKLLSGDARLRVRGHDFIDVLLWTIKKFKGVKGACSYEVLSRMLVLMAKGDRAIAGEIL